jgi:hypothetical protein
VRTLKPHDKALSAGLGAFVGVAMVLCAFAAIMLFTHPQEFRGHGSFYGGVLLFGVMQGRGREGI